MSLSWTPFLNDFFSCLLLALLFSCHSLARVSSLLLGMLLSCLQLAMLFSSCRSALFTRCGSALLASFHQDHPSVRVHVIHHVVLDLKLLVIFSVIIQSGHVCPKLLASIGAVFAPRRRCAFARSFTCCATSPRAPHTLCLQSSFALGRHSFSSNYNTACLLNCFVFLCSFSSTLW